MKLETKKTIVREWMSFFGSFWAACLLVLLMGVWTLHSTKALPSERQIVVLIVCAWVAIYVLHFAVWAIVGLRRKS